MKELRTFKLRKKSLVNKDILEKENAKQKAIDSANLELDERRKIQNMCELIRQGVEAEIDKAVASGETYISYDFSEDAKEVTIKLCEKYTDIIEELCQHYAAQGFEVGFEYVFHNSAGSTSWDSYITSRFRLDFSKDEGKMNIEIDRNCYT